MSGYSNLLPSPPMAAIGSTGRIELTNTKETKAWEGLAIGAVTLARNFSGSQGFRASERGKNGHHGLQGVVRRAFSMRGHPASSLAEGYWRIHDMDGDACEEPLEEKEQKEQQQVEGAMSKEENKVKKKTKRGNILKACRKILGL